MATAMTGPGAVSVLLVDDRPENLLALESALAGLDAKLVTVRSGEDALKALLREDFAAILLDVRMPGIDGFETAELVRARDRTRNIPIIFLTAEANDVQNVIRGYQAGAADFVLKPYDPYVLRSKVQVFCELDRERRARARGEALLERAIDASPVGMVMTDGAGTVQRTNPALRRMLGRPVIDDPIEDLLDPADQPALRRAREAVLAQHVEALTVSAHVAGRGDERIPVSIIVAPVRDGDGRLEALMVLVNDLRATRAAEETRSLLAEEQVARQAAETLARRLEQIAAIVDGLAALTLAELVPELCARIAAVLDAPGVAVVAFDDDGRVAVAASAGAEIAGEHLEHAVASGETVSTSSSLVVPLQGEDRRIGVVAVAGDNARIDHALVVHAVERAALTLERTRLYERERRIAATLQRDLLPDSLPAVPGISLSAHLRSGGSETTVGGDWYDAVTLPGGRVGLIVGDVAGRGIAAAARMGQLRSVARAYALEGHPPATVVGQINAYHATLGNDVLTTLVYVVIEPDLDQARIANAGHVPPLLHTPGAAPEMILGTGPPLGALEAWNHAETIVPLPPGSLLALCTDGLVERRGEPLDAGLDRLAGALVEAERLDIGDACAFTLDACLDAEGGEADDDVTLLLVRAEASLGEHAVFTLTADPEALLALRRTVRRWLVELDAEETESAEIVMAANEAFQNAIEHGSAFARTPITVTLDHSEGDVEIVIRDAGDGVGVRPRDPDRGRGVALMDGLMDEAVFDLATPRGGIVTLRRRLGSAQPGADGDGTYTDPRWTRVGKQ